VLLSLCVSGYYCPSLPQGRSCKGENWCSKMAEAVECKQKLCLFRCGTVPTATLAAAAAQTGSGGEAGPSPTVQQAGDLSFCFCSWQMTCFCRGGSACSSSEETNSDLRVTAVLGMSKEKKNNFGRVSLTWFGSLKNKTYLCVLWRLVVVLWDG